MTKVISVTSPSGGGKSTQTALLKKYLESQGLRVGLISTSKTLLKSGDAIVITTMEAGDMVDDKITASLILHKIVSMRDKFDVIIIDGTPRTPVMAELLLNDVDFLIYIDVSLEEQRKRLDKQRAANKGKRNDLADVAIAKRIEQRYRVEWATQLFLYEGRAQIVDGHKSEDAIAMDIITIVDGILKET